MNFKAKAIFVFTLIVNVFKISHNRWAGNRISIGSISLASHFIKLDLIDEYWFLVQPIISGGGKHLLEGMQDHHNLKLSDIKKFNSGVVVLHYKNAV